MFLLQKREPFVLVDPSEDSNARPVPRLCPERSLLVSTKPCCEYTRTQQLNLYCVCSQSVLYGLGNSTRKKPWKMVRTCAADEGGYIWSAINAAGSTIQERLQEKAPASAGSN